jgi:hypothetical protein
MEEQLAAGLGEGQLAELVDDDEIDAAELVAEPAGAPRAEFDLRPA